MKYAKASSFAQVGILKMNVLCIYINSSNVQTTVLGVNYKALKDQNEKS